MSALLNAAVGVSSEPRNNAFELTIETTAANETFLLPMQAVTSINVDWGDGNVDTNITSDDPTHVYATAGTYAISVTGTAGTVLFYLSGSQGKLRTVTNLGALGWTKLTSAFMNSSITSFNAGDCDTSNVTAIFRPFQNCTSLTNANVTGMDTSNVTNFNNAFRNCTALNDVVGLETLNIESVATFDASGGFMENVTLPTSRYDAVLVAWEAQTVNSDLSINFGNSKYSAHSAAATARANLISNDGWTITDGDAEDAPFQMTIETTTANETFTIPCQDFGTFDAVIDWGDGSPTSTVTAYNDANLVHTYATAGTYQISISGKFANIFFNSGGDKDKVLSVDNLGVCGWERLNGAFYGCTNMTSFTAGTCDTSAVDSMLNMFSGCTSVTTLDLSGFDTSNVTNFFRCFAFCSNLASVTANFDLSSAVSLNWMFSECSSLSELDMSYWNVSNVQDFNGVFRECSSLTTIDVSSWDTSSGTRAVGTFAGCSSITSLDVSNFDTSNMTDMNGMFQGCSSLTSLDVSNFDTSNVTNMSNVFNNCSSLTSLNVTNFDTSSVTNFSRLFESCSSLTSLDVSNFDTSSATSMNGMFSRCESLTSLDVTNFNTSNVTDMSSMFQRCYDLEFLSVSNFDTSNVTNMNGIFYFCSSITDIAGIESLNYESVQNTDLNLLGSTTIERSRLDRLLQTLASQNVIQNISINLGPAKYSANGAAAEAREFLINTYGWAITDGGEVDAPFQLTVQTTTANETFTLPCTNFGTFDATVDWGDGGATSEITAWNDPDLTHTYATAGTYQITITGKFGNIRFPQDTTSAEKVLSVDNLGTCGMSTLVAAFQNCTNMTSFTAGTCGTNDVTDMRSMFINCTSLTTLDLTNLDMSNVTLINSMFEGCSNLTTVDVSNWDVRNLTDMRRCFRYCTSLTTVDVSDWKTDSLVYFGSHWDQGAFSRCSSLTSVDMTNWNMSNVINMAHGFLQCSSLTSVGDTSNWDLSQVTETRHLFEQCSSLLSLNVSNWDVSNITLCNNMFSGCSSLTEIDVQNWDTSNFTSIQGIFSGTGVETLSVQNWNTSNCTIMASAFSECSNLITINVSNWNVSSVTSFHRMFRSSVSLQDIGNLSNWDTSSATDMGGFIYNTDALTDLKGMENFNIENVTSFSQFNNSSTWNVGFGRENYDKLLISWSQQNVASGLVFSSSTPCSANGLGEEARNYLITNYSWVFDGPPPLNSPFQMTIQTTTANETFTIPCQNVGAFDCTITWGDGTNSTITAYNDANLTHTYATAGTYQISVSGKFGNIYFNNSGDKDKVLSVDNLGTCGMSTLAGAFYGCTNMTSFTAGTCDTLGVTSLFRMLADCLNITSCDVSTMNTENVTNMQETFSNVGQATEIVGIENWNTSKVTTMRGMFSMYNALRPVLLEGVNVTNFDTSNVTDMVYMFALWEVKLQPNAIDVSNFNTSKVENTTQMFRRTEIPDLDFRRWDTSKVTSMNFMLERIGSPEETVLGLETLNVQSITTNGLRTASLNIPTEQYDAMLINYAAQSVQTGVTLQVGGGTQYTPGGDAEAARNTLINTYGWTITDSGPVT